VGNRDRRHVSSVAGALSGLIGGRN
jgi:hypothetical protein